MRLINPAPSRHSTWAPSRARAGDGRCSGHGGGGVGMPGCIHDADRGTPHSPENRPIQRHRRRIIRPAPPRAMRNSRRSAAVPLTAFPQPRRAVTAIRGDHRLGDRGAGRTAALAPFADGEPLARTRKVRSCSCRLAPRAPDFPMLRPSSGGAVPDGVPGPAARMPSQLIPWNSTRPSLSPRPFDFLVNGQFLRGSLGALIEQSAMYTEEIIRLEFVEAMAPPAPPQQQPHDDWVSGVAGRADGAFATASYDGNGRLWTDSGELLAVLAGHTAGLGAICWLSSDDSGPDAPLRCATASEDETVRLWRAEPTGGEASCVVSCTGATARLACVAAQPTGAMVAAGGWDDCVRIWSAAETDADDIAPDTPAAPAKRRRGGGASSAPAPPPERPALGLLTGSGGYVSSLAWPERGTLYSAGADHAVRVWDIESGTNTRSLAGSRVISGLDFSAEANLVAAAEFDGAVRIYDPRSAGGKVVKVALASHRSPCTSVSWRPGSSTQLLSGSLDTSGGNLKLWDIRSASIPVHNIDGCGDKVLSVGWAGEGMALSGSADGKARMHAME